MEQALLDSFGRELAPWVAFTSMAPPARRRDKATENIPLAKTGSHVRQAPGTAFSGRGDAEC